MTVPDLASIRAASVLRGVLDEALLERIVKWAMRESEASAHPPTEFLGRVQDAISAGRDLAEALPPDVLDA